MIGKDARLGDAAIARAAAGQPVRTRRTRRKVEPAPVQVFRPDPLLVPVLKKMTGGDLRRVEGLSNGAAVVHNHHDWHRYFTRARGTV